MRRRLVWIGAAAFAAVLAVTLVWFQPHLLFVDERVDEPVPEAVTVTSGRRAAAPELVVLARGRFVSLDHGTSGAVRVLDLGDGDRVVRLDALDTSNGPDLYVYLSRNPADGDESAFDDDYVSLGRLKGNQGDQNYSLPKDIDLSRFASVVVWCDRFDSAFGAADLAVGPESGPG